MLSKEDNDLLTRIGPGTPMGNLLRQYWQPALLSSELPERDGPPLRVRLLGEDLIAFRDTQGKVGLLGARCPHRGAPLYFARNEDCGLRCIYHGWKFDTDGRCLETPNVPGDRDVRNRVRAKSYRCFEANGLVWAYMGAAAELPPRPELGFTNVPVEHKVMTKQLLECNYAQALEGDLDPSHVSFLHAPLDPRGQSGYQGTAGILSEQHLSEVALEQDVKARDRSPQISVLKTDYGLFVGARRDAGDRYYWRFTQLVMPFYVYVPGAVGSPVHCNVWQPMDDEHTMVWRIQYLSDRPFRADERSRLLSGTGAHIPPEGYLPATSEPGGAWMPRASRANDYQQDRGQQKKVSFSGIRGIWAQDRACTEGMGAIMDRTEEHLVASDATIVQMRRVMLAAAKQGVAPGLGIAPPIMANSTVFQPKSLGWEELSRDYLHGKTPAAA
jgi:phenylpropionate dioxygenase-like ring-hydroxylating dioxygenase large terminal subunit